MCSFCADYYSATLAREAIKLAKSLIEGGDGKEGWTSFFPGAGRGTFGDAIEFTVPDYVSEYLDKLLRESPGEFRKREGQMRRAVMACVLVFYQRVLGELGLPVPQRASDIGAMIVLHHWGSKDPTKARYHYHLVVLPLYRSTGVEELEDDKGESWGKQETYTWAWLPKVIDKAVFLKVAAEISLLWEKRVRRICGLQAVVDNDASGKPKRWNWHRAYLKGEAQLAFELAYQLRAPMKDVWQHVVGNGRYQAMARRQKGEKRAMPYPAIEFGSAEMSKAVERARGVQAAVRRSNWYGLLAPGVEAKTFEALDMIREPDQEELTEDGDLTWAVRDVTELGVLLEADNGITEFVPWKEFRPYAEKDSPRAKPIGVKRRARWVSG
ncbi:MAG: hypothetical protein V1724_05725 [Chloroflexota bacterium]